MSRPLHTEALEVMAEARAWLEELVEEGVDAFEPLPPEAQVTAAPSPLGPPARPEPGPVEGASEEKNGPPADSASDTASPRETAAPPSLSFQPTLPRDGPRPTLEQVRSDLGECTRCRLHEGRQTIVFGDGNPDADLMFVGEGPGENEDRRGLPFVGRAGELLTQMIEKGLGIPRSEVYICNVVKCRPPGNRTPMADEVSTCSPFLEAQIDAVAPKVIVALGKPAASLLLGREVPITRVRGSWHEFRGIPMMPTLHPAYVLRQYTDEVRRNVWNDLKSALERSREA